MTKGMSASLDCSIILDRVNFQTASDQLTIQIDFKNLFVIILYLR
jgi:nucleoid-associated protein YejK